MSNTMTNKMILSQINGDYNFKTTARLFQIIYYHSNKTGRGISQKPDQSIKSNTIW
jgi:hypothetical protein